MEESFPLDRWRFRDWEDLGLRLSSEDFFWIISQLLVREEGARSSGAVAGGEADCGYQGEGDEACYQGLR